MTEVMMHSAVSSQPLQSYGHCPGIRDCVRTQLSQDQWASEAAISSSGGATELSPARQRWEAKVEKQSRLSADGTGFVTDAAALGRVEH